MCDDHLTQCLDETDCVDGIFEERCCSRKDILRNTFRLKDGLDLVVSQNRKTFRCIGMLVLSGNRFKNYSIEDLVKETFVETRVEACKTSKRFLRSSSECETDLTLCDTDQKRICVTESSMKLQAIVLGGGQENHTVNFKMVKYHAPQSTDGQTVQLSLNDYTLLSSKKNGQTELWMEKVANKEDLNCIDSNSDLTRFLFIKRCPGGNLTQYESVSCPGWFISTNTDQSVGLYKKCAQRNFSFSPN